MTFNGVSERFPWIWAMIGTLLLWLILMLHAGHFSISPLMAAMISSSFLLITAIGQSFAMMTGAGNVDLSMPSVITITSYISVYLIGGQNDMVWAGMLAAIGVGVIVGTVNGLCIVILRIPAIIATLAVGYIVTTLCLLANRTVTTNSVAPVLSYATTGRLFGMPVIVLIALCLTLCAGLIYSRIGFGRLLLATGQNHLAARMAGIPTAFVIVIAFIVSGALAGLTGVLLGARSGGAFLDMGKPYLLLSIGAVVIGGTPLFGGRVTVTGCAMGALFLVLLSTLMPVIGFSGGEAEILQGAMIIAVLVIGGMRLRSRLKQAD